MGQVDRWYAVRVKSNREWITAETLKVKGFPVCLPAYRERRRQSTNTLTVELPLFPGYLFCCFDAAKRLPILMVSGVVHIVSCGRVPQPVDSREMAAVLSIVNSGLIATRHHFPSVGQTVQLDCGPLAGAEGVILSEAGEEEFVVSVTLLQRSIAVKVDRNWIKPHPLKTPCAKYESWHTEVC